MKHLHQMHSLEFRYRGAVVIYMLVMLPIVFLMASLAVDYGRAQAAKTQLQNAVDAAIRSAGQDLMNFQPNATAQSTAIAVAAQNKVDGQSVTLQSSDIIFGTWDNNTKVFTPNTSSTNAICINAARSAVRGNAIPTLFSAVVGSNSVDIHASAIAYITQDRAPFNAMGDVTFNETGNTTGTDWRTDSYIGNNNPYSANTKRGNGNLATNGSVKYNFVTPAGAGTGTENMISNSVEGTIYTADGQNCTQTWQNNATGPGTYWIQYGGWNNPGPTTTNMGTPMSKATPTMPTDNNNPTIPSGYVGGSHTNGLLDLNVADGSIVHLPAGTYTLNSISISNNSTVIFDGPVTLNIAESLTVNSAAMLPQVNDPKYMAINICNEDYSSNNTITFSNLTQNLYADINGPKANLSFTQNNNGNSIFGRVYSRDMIFNCTGNGGVHGNESLLMSLHIVK